MGTGLVQERGKAMESISPIKRNTHFDTALHIYGVVRKPLEEIKISFVVARKDWKQFRGDIESYGAFQEFDHFLVDGQSIRLLGPVRGYVLARGSAEQNSELLAYMETHPAFNINKEHVHKTARALNLIRNGAAASS
jgi:hypothetical protein